MAGHSHLRFVHLQNMYFGGPRLAAIRAHIYCLFTKWYLLQQRKRAWKFRVGTQREDLENVWEHT